MTFQYGSIPLGTRIQGFNLYQGATQSFNPPIPASSYNTMALKQNYTKYPSLKQSGLLDKIVSLSSGATETFKKPIPASDYNKRALGAGYKKYPSSGFNPFTPIMPIDPSGPTPPSKKFSYLEIINTLEQQFPMDAQIKAIKKDLVLLEIAKQSRPLTDDEIKLENEIKKKIDNMVAKPMSPWPVEPSAIPPGGEQAPQSADILTDADRKKIDQLGANDDDKAAIVLSKKINKTDDIDALFKKWDNDIKKYSGLSGADLDIDIIKQNALIGSIEKEYDDAINDPIFRVDKKEKKELKKYLNDAIKKTTTTNELLDILNGFRKEKKERYDAIKRDDQAVLDEIERISKEYSDKYFEIRKKIQKIDENIAITSKKGKRNRLILRKGNLESEIDRLEKEQMKAIFDAPRLKDAYPVLKERQRYLAEKLPDIEKIERKKAKPPKKSSPEQPKKSSSLSEPPKSEPPKSEPVLAEEEEKEHKPFKTTEIEKDYNELVKLIKSKSKNNDKIEEAADKLSIYIPVGMPKNELLDYVYEKVTDDEILDAYIPMLKDKTNATGKRRMTNQEVIDFAKSDFGIDVPEEGKNRKDIVDYIETAISKQIIYRDTKVKIPERITTMKQLEDYYGRPMAKA